MKTALFFAAVALLTLISTAASADGMPASTARSREPGTSGVLSIENRPHPYLMEGSGLTCIVTGLAPSYPPLYSARLKQHIRFVYVDFKNTWNAESADKVDTVTMDTLVEEIDQVRAALHLDKVCVVGHSAPGFVALEYALRHPDRTSHAILVAVEAFFTDAHMKERASFWERDASAERKAARAKNGERITDDLLRSLSPRDSFALRYVRNGPRYFYDYNYDFYWAWAGRQFSAEHLVHYLSRTLAGYDPRPKLAENAVPIFLVLGRYDYDVPYYEWDSGRKAPHVTSYLFERSGHFPMIEEPDLFDKRLIGWLKAQR